MQYWGWVKYHYCQVQKKTFNDTKSAAFDVLDACPSDVIGRLVLVFHESIGFRQQHGPYEVKGSSGCFPVCDDGISLKSGAYVSKICLKIIAGTQISWKIYENLYLDSFNLSEYDLRVLENSHKQLLRYQLG
jgi:hypothetical protein